MTASEVHVNFNLHVIRGFLDSQSCQRIVSKLSSASHSPATVYGLPAVDAVNDAVRKSIRLTPDSETLELIMLKLGESRAEVGARFEVNLERTEAPQFLRYSVGDFFVAHQDGNTGLMLSEREQFRKVSVVIFLNHEAEVSDAEAFGGGSLVFTEWRAGYDRGQFRLKPEEGMLVAFPSELTHEVTPVTWGERYSIVSWYG